MFDVQRYLMSRNRNCHPSLRIEKIVSIVALFILLQHPNNVSTILQNEFENEYFNCLLIWQFEIKKLTYLFKFEKLSNYGNTKKHIHIVPISVP